MIKKIMLVLFLCSLHAMSFEKKESVTLTVFVHGTLFPSLATLNPFDVLFDTLREKSDYVQSIKKLRTHEQLQEDQILLDCGLHEIDLHKPLNEKEKKQAAYFLTSAYDAVAREVGAVDGDARYFAFGHKGLLSASYRKEAGFQLYAALELLYNTYAQQYKQVKIVVVTHSHGANVALSMQEARNENKKKSAWSVDELLLFGPPLQSETVVYAYGPLFKYVFNISSEWDFLQVADSFSVRSGSVYKYFSHDAFKNFSDKKKNVYDVVVSIKDDVKKINHHNMWFLGRSKILFTSFDLLPLVVLAPLIVHQLLATHNNNSFFDCVIDENVNNFSVTFMQHYTKQQISEKKYPTVYKTLQNYNEYSASEWAPANSSREMLPKYNNAAFIKKEIGYWQWIRSYFLYECIRMIKKFLR